MSLPNGRSTVVAPSHVRIRTIDGTEMNNTNSDNETLKEILGELRGQSERMRERYKEKKEDSLGESEWRVVAMVVDRFFFILLLVITLIMSCVIFEAVM